MFRTPAPYIILGLRALHLQSVHFLTSYCVEVTVMLRAQELSASEKKRGREGGG